MTPKYVVKKKVEIKEPFPGYKKISTADDTPTAADKKREREMIESLSKEDFFGDKKKKPQDYIKKTYKSVKEEPQDYIKKTNKLIAAKMKAKKP